MTRHMVLGTASVASALAGFAAGLLVTSELAVASAPGNGRALMSASDHILPGHGRHTKVIDARTATGPRWTRLVPAKTTQVVRTVSSRFWCDHAWCSVTQAWHEVRGEWVLVKRFRSSIGRNGWGKQREGDLRSPNGVYRVKVTFSTGGRAPGRMAWKRRKPTSVVTAQPGRLYNTWIEERRRSDGDRPSMRFGFVVDFNHVRLRRYVGPKPVAGKGSGIFYHTSRPGRTWSPTEGCTQVGNVENMRWLVQWLRPGAHPRIVQNR